MIFLTVSGVYLQLRFRGCLRAPDALGFATGFDLFLVTFFFRVVFFAFAFV